MLIEVKWEFLDLNDSKDEFRTNRWAGFLFDIKHHIMKLPSTHKTQFTVPRCIPCR